MQTAQRATFPSSRVSQRQAHSVCSLWWTIHGNIKKSKVFVSFEFVHINPTPSIILMNVSSWYLCPVKSVQRFSFQTLSGPMSLKPLSVQLFWNKNMLTTYTKTKTQINRTSFILYSFTNGERKWKSKTLFATYLKLGIIFCFPLMNILRMLDTIPESWILKVLRSCN
jgi:hypothetical protein